MRYARVAGRIGLRERLFIFRESLPVNQPTGDRSIGIDAAVTQEGPVAADIFEVSQVHFAEQDLFFVMRSFGDDATKRVTKEGSSPEFEAFSGNRIAADVPRFESHAIHHAYVDAVGDSVGPLDGSPRIVLRDTELGLLRRMPSDGGRIEQNACALQRRNARTFRIPLIP